MDQFHHHEEIKGYNYKNSLCLQDHTVALYDFNSGSYVAVRADDSETPVCSAKASEGFSRIIFNPSTDFIQFICSKYLVF
jgi:hypothetical protein